MFASLSSASTRVPALDMICLTMSWTLSQPTLLFHSSSLGWSYRSFMMWKEFLRVTHPGVCRQILGQDSILVLFVALSISLFPSWRRLPARLPLACGGVWARPVVHRLDLLLSHGGWLRASPLVFLTAELCSQVPRVAFACRWML